jgi:F420-dependent hydroxymycolic acid dehydrogenase
VTGRFTAGALDQPDPVEIQRAAESNPIDKGARQLDPRHRPGPRINAVQSVLDAGAVPFLHFAQDDPVSAIENRLHHNGFDA